MNRITAGVLAVCLGALLSACGGGSSSPSGNQPISGASISGLADKGPVSNGTVTAYAVSDAGTQGAAITQTMTDGSGHFFLTLGSYTGPVFFELTGGSYIDEATGQTVNIPTAMGSGLQAVVSNVTTDSTLEVQITPLTTLAAARARGMVGGYSAMNIDTANKQVGTYFGGIDILGTAPIDPRMINSAVGAPQQAVNYGLILAGFSEQAQTLGLANPFDLVLALAQDFSDGSFNGKSGTTPVQINGTTIDPATGTTILAAGINAFSSDTSHNLSGGTVSFTLIDAISNQTANIDYVVGVRITGLIGTVELSNNVTDKLTLSGNGVFSFAAGIADGNPYEVAVVTQPAGQTCTVTNGSGTINATNVTDLSVTCAADPGPATPVCNPNDPGSPNVAPDVKIPTNANIGAGTIIYTGATIGGYASTGVCSIIEDNARLGERAKVGDGADVGSNGLLGYRASIGVSTIVGPYSSIGSNGGLGDHSSLGTGPDSSRIGADARVGTNTIIGDGASIGSAARVGNYVIVGNNAHIGNNAKVCDGAVVGQGANISGGDKYGCQ